MAESGSARRADMARVLPVLWALVAAGAVASALLRAWVTDDIFITFRYCDNLLAGLGPVYNAGERSEGYTHFLWFLLLALGRAAGIDPLVLGKYAGLPFDLGILWLLVRLSGRLFPERGGLRGVPVAMIGWAALEDARRFASGGLETAPFTFFLLLGFDCLICATRPRRAALAGWALAVATLLRPDGLLFTLLGGLYLAWQHRQRGAIVRDYAVVWTVLATPLFAFRMLYYGYPLPNPYYAKSGGAANWAQGWLYARLYFQSYFVLGLAAVAALPIVRSWRRGPEARERASALVFAGVAALVTVLYVIRVGGDFMFARFFLPVTPFLLLLAEAAVHILPRFVLRVAGAAAVAALFLYGAERKHRWLGAKRNVAGIVDEPLFYPDTRMQEVKRLAEPLRRCLAGTSAVFLVQGGQASLAYWARYPVAVERHGLTDETIAHSPVGRRGRPGHEKFPPAPYVYQRRVNFRVNYQPVRSAPLYSQFQIGEATGEIVVYDRTLMEKLKACPQARFLDFPKWLAETYIPSVPQQVLTTRLVEDWTQFHLFYFNHNPDPERLRDHLRAALRARGVTSLPETVDPAVEFATRPSPF